MAKPTLTETDNEIKLTDEWGDALIVEKHTTKSGEERVSVFLEMRNGDTNDFLDQHEVIADYPAKDFWRFIAEMKLTNGAEK